MKELSVEELRHRIAVKEYKAQSLELKASSVDAHMGHGQVARDAQWAAASARRLVDALVVLQRYRDRTMDIGLVDTGLAAALRHCQPLVDQLVVELDKTGLEIAARQLEQMERAAANAALNSKQLRAEAAELRREADGLAREVERT